MGPSSSLFRRIFHVVSKGHLLSEHVRNIGKTCGRKPEPMVWNVSEPFDDMPVIYGKKTEWMMPSGAQYQGVTRATPAAPVFPWTPPSATNKKSVLPIGVRGNDEDDEDLRWDYGDDGGDWMGEAGAAPASAASAVYQQQQQQRERRPIALPLAPAPAGVFMDDEDESTDM